MYSTSVYFNIPRQTVVLYFGDSTRRYQTVYAKNLTLHKGVDNKIQFKFINQDQKAVDITDKEITCRIMSTDGTVELIKTSLVPVLPLTGLAELQLRENDLDDILAQNGFYSIEIPDGTFNIPVFVDSNSGAKGKIEIVDSVRPKHVTSDTLTIEDHREAIHFAPVTYYSGQFNSRGNPLLTFQVYLDNYSGDIQFQGTTMLDTDWYNIDSPNTHDSATGTYYYTVEGFHPKVRVQFKDSTSGNATKILFR